MAGENITPAQIPPGAVLTYYGDIASGAIRPEDVRVEALTFRAIIDRNGLITFATPKITVVSRFNLAIRAIYGSIINPELAGAAAGLIRFNLQEQGRSFNVFKQAVSMSGVANGGSAVPYEWDGVYICVPGTDIEATWSVDQALWTTLVGAPRIVEIVVTGDYIACGPQGR